MNLKIKVRIKNAVCFGLGIWLPRGRPMPDEWREAQQDWQIIFAWLSKDRERIKDLAKQMVDSLVEAIAWASTKGTTLQTPGSNMEERWRNLQRYLEQNKGLLDMMAHDATNVIPEDIFQAPATQPPKLQPQSFARPGSNPNPPSTPKPQPLSGNPVTGYPASPVQPPLSPSGERNQEGKIGRHLDPIKAPPETTNMPSTSETGMNDAGKVGNEREVAEPAVTQTPSLSPQWKWLPLPDEPAKHEESDEKMKDTLEGMKLIGARVRGKKHKHDGTNCDDWFEFAVNGPWTIIVVSDGAGSKKFSRVGARIACREAVEYLKTTLEDCRLDLCDFTEVSFQREGDDQRFDDDQLQKAQGAVHIAMNQAHAAVLREAEYLKNAPEYEKVLGRKVEFDDLSGTLLIAVHTTISIGTDKRSFVLTCQIGDGMLGVIDREGRLQLLGEPDSGEFAGQTDFLTNKRKVGQEALANKTFVWQGSLQSLMVMSDGVADDYYPNDPGLLQLYGDLCLNQIIQLSGLNDEDIASELAQTALPTQKDVISKREDFSVPGITATGNGHEKVTLLSAAAYAEKLGRPIEQLVRSPAWLIAGARAGAGPGYLHEKGSPAERLRWWLDTYQVRGSFDDRTLVILHRGKAS